MTGKEALAWVVGILVVGGLVGATLNTSAGAEQHTSFIVSDIKLPSGLVECSSVVFRAEDVCGIEQIKRTKEGYCLFCIIINTDQGKEFHYFGSMDLSQTAVLRQDFVYKMAKWMEWKDKQSKEVIVTSATDEIEDAGDVDNVTMKKLDDSCATHTEEVRARVISSREIIDLGSVELGDTHE